MNEFAEYVAGLIKTMEAGTFEEYPIPDPPADLGTPLTQDEIDFVKKLKKDMEERFTPLP